MFIIKQIKCILTSIVFFFISFHSFSQGCSDAGFCTMGAMRPNQFFKRKINLRLRSIEISQYFARTKFEDNIYSTTIDLNIGLSPKSSFQVKIPYTQIIGKLDKVKGWGDFSFSFTKSIIQKEKYHLNATIGTKVPTNNSNHKDDDGHSFTMYFQTSLGTYDAIGGLSLITKKWLVAVGYQQPLNSNQNEFNKKTWALTGSPDSTIAKRYPNSTNLKRGNDIMLRVERNFRFSRFNCYAGLLNIYRINKDIATNENGIRGEVINSNGLVINLLAGAGYNFSAKMGIKFLFGIKLKERKSNPDGLSREIVSTLGYEYRF